MRPTLNCTDRSRDGPVAGTRRVRATTGDTAVLLVTGGTSGRSATGGAEIPGNFVVDGSLLVVRTSTDDVMSPCLSGWRRPGPGAGSRGKPRVSSPLSARIRTADAESAPASLTMSPTARILVADDWPAVTVTTTSDAQVVR